MDLKLIVQLVNGELFSGTEGKTIARVNTLESAGPEELTFLANDRYFKQCLTTQAGAVMMKPGDYQRLLEHRTDLTVIVVENPYLAFARVLQAMDTSPKPLREISARATIDPSAVIGERVAIYPGVYIGANARIGQGSVIYPNCTLEDDVVIGEESIIYANVVIRYATEIGNRVIVHSGTVIGSDGFGFAPDESRYFYKIPQLGKVILEDDVEIGANVTIDRAVLGETRICKGAKLDNLIQVGHNVVIGANTVIAAQTGISGSVHIGSANMIGGQVGFAGHISTGDRVMVAAQSGLHKNLPDESVVLGSPARPIMQARRIEAIISQLPDYIRLLRKVARELKISFKD